MKLKLTLQTLNLVFIYFRKMTSPLKPWEIRPDVARRSQIPNTTGRPTVRFRIPPGTTKSDVTMDQRDFDSPPPIPSRQRNTEQRGSNVPYGSSYYGTSTYGMPGGYGYGGMLKQSIINSFNYSKKIDADFQNTCCNISCDTFSTFDVTFYSFCFIKTNPSINWGLPIIKLQYMPCAH